MLCGCPAPSCQRKIFGTRGYMDAPLTPTDTPGRARDFYHSAAPAFYRHGPCVTIVYK